MVSRACERIAARQKERERGYYRRHPEAAEAVRRAVAEAKANREKMWTPPVSHQIYSGCLALRLVGADLESVLPWGILLVFQRLFLIW
jgi:hypothetical protein